MSLARHIDEFLSHCRVRGLSDHTLRAYRQDLGDFHAWVRRTRREAPLTHEAVRDWISDMRQRGLAPASIKRRLACLKGFCRRLEEDGVVDPNPFHGLRATIRLPKRLPRHLSRVEWTRLLDAAGRQMDGDFSALTLQLALELLFTTGMRVGELCAIRLPDIDLASRSILIRGKGSRERRVFLVDDGITALLTDYIARRSPALPDLDRLLLGPRGTAVTPDTIRKSLHRHAEALALNRRITPHMFRHTAATELLENGVDIRFVQKLLGHASISTTEIYTHVTDSSLRDAVTAANPRRRV